VSAIEIHLSEGPPGEDHLVIFRKLAGFNEEQVGPAGRRDLAVFARCGTEIVGGLVGFTHWNWFQIHYLWVAEPQRRQGIGRRLLDTAEEEARRRGIQHAHVDTFSFQALPFYERLGYSVFGRIEDYPPGHTRYYLQKRDLICFSP
jgi:ribosomal protein S18 acetylase RimI-like enzyme